MILILPFIFLLLLIAIRVPIGFSLIIASILTFVVTGHFASIAAIPHILFTSMEHFTLLAIPFFILTAELLVGGRLVDLLFQLTSAFLGRVPGGLGIVSVAATMLFAGIQGSSAADAAAIGRIGTEGMKKEGYNDAFAASLIATSGSLAIMIPPSIAMIIYGALSQTSIGALFYAGIIPGAIIGLILMGYTALIAYSNKYGISSQKYSWRDRFKLTWRSLPLLGLPLVVLYGFYTGKFTATEIGTATTFYSLIISLLVYKTIKLHDIPRIVIKATITTVAIFIIIGGAILFQRVLIQQHINSILFQFIQEASLKPWEFLMLVSAILYFLGMFMEGVALNVMTTPILVPLAIALGIDPVHYGIVLVYNIEIALISPPVGMNLFVLSAATGISIERLYKAILPFLIIAILGLGIIIGIPQLSLMLPKLLLK